MTVSLHKIEDSNRAAVLALRVAPEQEQFVSTVSDAREDAEAYPQGNPWYRAIYAVDAPVGFSWLVPYLFPLLAFCRAIHRKCSA